MRCNGSNWAVYSPGSWDGFRNDLWALWAGGNNAPWAPLSWWIRALYKSTYYYYYYVRVFCSFFFSKTRAPIVETKMVKMNVHYQIPVLYLPFNIVWEVHCTCLFHCFVLIDLSCMINMYYLDWNAFMEAWYISGGNAHEAVYGVLQAHGLGLQTHPTWTSTQISKIWNYTAFLDD